MLIGWACSFWPDGFAQSFIWDRFLNMSIEAFVFELYVFSGFSRSAYTKSAYRPWEYAFFGGHT